MRLISPMLLYYLILSPIAADTLKSNTKLCINCKFFKKGVFHTNIYGKCTKFPKEPYDNYSLYIDGVVKKKNEVDYSYCSIARKYEDMCGKDAILYEKK